MQSRWLSISAMLMVLALAVLPLASSASVVVPTFSEMVAAAERIAVTEVVEVREVMDETRGERVPITLVTFRTVKTLKGRPSAQLQLEFLGGDAQSRLRVLNLPRFRPGDRDVLFLKPDGEHLSPLVGLTLGRFRVSPGGDWDSATLSGWNGQRLSDRDITLASFERQVLSCLTDRESCSGAVISIVDETVEDRRQVQSPEPIPVRLELGSAPVLANGCPDWACAVRRRAAGLIRVVAPGNKDSGASLTLRWGFEVYGRQFDEEVLAVTLLHTTDRGEEIEVVFNRRKPWNAFDEASPGQAGRAASDLGRVAEAELARLLARDGVSVGREARQPGSSVTEQGEDEASVGIRSGRVGTLNAACPGGSALGAVTDPTFLVFRSPDHGAMLRYEVGFFRPSAPEPVQVVSLPLDAVVPRGLEKDRAKERRRAGERPRRDTSTFWVDILAAGIESPVGEVYQYGLRGVWRGGTTAWSDRSQPFIRCGGAP